MLRLPDPVRPAAAGLLRVSAEVADLRGLLVLDLARRTAQACHLRVRLASLSGPGTAVGPLTAQAEALNIHLPEVSDAPGTGTDLTLGAGVVPLEGMPEGDPLAVRLHLLGTHYRSPVTVDAQAVARAAAELAGWRAAVAAGAESPSAPIRTSVRAAVLDAFCDDLDTPRALSAVRAFLSEDPPGGCVFETLAWADQLLGLDLARDVGR